MTAGGRDGQRDVDAIEREVVFLRDDCARILGELERRYVHAAALPKRIGREAVRIEQGSVRLVRAHPVAVAVGVALLGVGLVVLGRGRRRRRRISDRRSAFALLTGQLGDGLREGGRTVRRLPLRLRRRARRRRALRRIKRLAGG
jgi:hypothetical protein